MFLTGLLRGMSEGIFFFFLKSKKMILKGKMHILKKYDEQINIRRAQ